MKLPNNERAFTLEDLKTAFNRLVDVKSRNVYPVIPVIYTTPVIDTSSVAGVATLEDLEYLKGLAAGNYIVGLAVGVASKYHSIGTGKVKKIFGGLEISINGDGLVPKNPVLNYDITKDYYENQIPESITDVKDMINLAREVSLDHLPPKKIPDSTQTLTQIILCYDKDVAKGHKEVAKEPYNKDEIYNLLERLQVFRRRMNNFNRLISEEISKMAEGQQIFVGMLYNKNNYGLNIGKKDGIYEVKTELPKILKSQ